jgi:hypothetical protein
MQNYFDFYVITAHSDSKRAIKKIPNLQESEIFKTYSVAGRWTKPSYSARVAFIDVMGLAEEAKGKVDSVLESLPKIDGVRYHTKYIVRD